MKATSALASLRDFGRSVLTTADATARLGMTRSAASRLLARLATDGLVTRLRAGLWSIEPRLDPLALPEALTAPYPAYVSLQTALYHHGLIEQIPQVIYAVTLGRPRRVRTTLGTYSIHRLAPRVFGGYERPRASTIQLATPEKALFDLAYLTPSRSRLFTRLPELEIPRGFRIQELRHWIARIAGEHRRAMVEARLTQILASANGPKIPRASGARRKPVGRRS